MAKQQVEHEAKTTSSKKATVVAVSMESAYHPAGC